MTWCGITMWEENDSHCHRRWLLLAYYNPTKCSVVIAFECCRKSVGWSRIEYVFLSDYVWNNQVRKGMIYKYPTMANIDYLLLRLLTDHHFLAHYPTAQSMMNENTHTLDDERKHIHNDQHLEPSLHRSITSKLPHTLINSRRPKKSSTTYSELHRQSKRQLQHQPRIQNIRCR